MTRAQIVWTVVGSALALMATSSSAAWIVSRTIAESEARLRTEIQTVNRRIDALDDRMHQRIDALDDTMNQRIDALDDTVNQRIHSVNQRLDTVLLDGGR